MNSEKIINRCIEEMNTRNLTNKDVSRIANISEATVSRALSSKGQNVSVATLDAICAALSIELGGGAYTVEPEQTNIAEVYDARIADLKQIIAVKDRWLKVMFIALAVLVGFILTVLAIDIANPSVGWFRSALGITARVWRDIWNV